MKALLLFLDEVSGCLGSIDVRPPLLGVNLRLHLQLIGYALALQLPVVLIDS